MRYMLMVYYDESELLNKTQAQKDALLDQYRSFNSRLLETGKMIGGEALQPTFTGKRVEVRNGTALTTDGPFAETKEQLGGIYIVDAGSIDEAAGLASMVPHASSGYVEVRPIMEYEELRHEFQKFA